MEAIQLAASRAEVQGSEQSALASQVVAALALNQARLVLVPGLDQPEAQRP